MKIEMSFFADGGDVIEKKNRQQLHGGTHSHVSRPLREHRRHLRQTRRRRPRSQGPRGGTGRQARRRRRESQISHAPDGHRPVRRRGGEAAEEHRLRQRARVLRSGRSAIAGCGVERRRRRREDGGERRAQGQGDRRLKYYQFIHYFDIGIIDVWGR